MAREDLHFRLRIPESLKEQVEKASLENRRSMTAEIIARLEASFEAPQELASPYEALIQKILDSVETNMKSRMDTMFEDLLGSDSEQSAVKKRRE
ncbi:hypothetical protein NS365_13390 [Aureimonas ureilytica]|uniref:Arc-like DNA binding domain-containing protein n=1 Tax=Aureimonas ureilytica TaxID=401562 RepID=A0A175RMS6_9HYPH|nr:Arc family DNA-binding protein [Aureimonas ureilytica]KTR05016.1 hypothetical protein NS365_13390 [Aureimonas ureilytica]